MDFPFDLQGRPRDTKDYQSISDPQKASISAYQAIVLAFSECILVYFKPFSKELGVLAAALISTEARLSERENLCHKK